MNHNIHTPITDEFACSYELKLDWLGFDAITFNIVALSSIATMNSRHSCPILLHNQQFICE
jgi:hypothetical protein